MITALGFPPSTLAVELCYSETRACLCSSGLRFIITLGLTLWPVFFLQPAVHALVCLWCALTWYLLARTRFPIHSTRFPFTGGQRWRCRVVGHATALFFFSFYSYDMLTLSCDSIPFTVPFFVLYSPTREWVVVRTVVAPPLSVVECGVGRFVRVVVCVWCCSCRVVVCVTWFSWVNPG